MDLLKRHRLETLPPFGRNYLRHVLAEYEVAPAEDKDVPEALKSFFQRAKDQPDTLSWADLFLLEKFILSRQAGALLRRRVWFLRDKYREVSGPRSYAAYLESRPPDANDEKIDEAVLRADLDRLLAALHWCYSLTPIRERIRTGIARSTSFLLGAWLLLVVVAVAISFWKDETLIATLLLIMICGATGGFISLQRRVANVPSEGDPLVGILQLENASASAYLAPLSGSIFAVLLYLIFLGKLVGGTIFPEVTSFDFSIGSMGWKSDPPSEPAVQYAKLLVWSFIAGFAERFVPDALDRLVSRGQQSMSGASANSTVVVTGTGTGDGGPNPKDNGGSSGSGSGKKANTPKPDEQKEEGTGTESKPEPKSIEASNKASEESNKNL